MLSALGRNTNVRVRVWWSVRACRILKYSRRGSCCSRIVKIMCGGFYVSSGIRTRVVATRFLQFVSSRTGKDVGGPRASAHRYRRCRKRSRNRTLQCVLGKNQLLHQANAQTSKSSYVYEKKNKICLVILRRGTKIKYKTNRGKTDTMFTCVRITVANTKFRNRTSEEAVKQVHRSASPCAYVPHREQI